MALVVKDRVKVYSSTTGTGTLSLGSAFAGFQTFNNALGDGDTTYYGIFESSTGNWEVGLGTYTSSGNTLSRDTILESSNAGAAVNLTADTEVFITYPAEKSVYFDASGDVNLTRDPQSALQAATKQYVDTIAAAGLHYHAPVRVEHPSNLTATYDNGTSGVGATLTNSGTQAVLVLDNVTMVVSDRVLIANQTNQAHNGVYTVTNIGSASTNWVLTRATDADSYGPSDPDALGEGDAFFIKEGDTNAGHLDVMTTSGTITFGTTNIVFSEVAETTVYSAGNGLSLSGTEFNVGPGTGITVNATTVSTVQDIATSATPTFDGLNTTGDITFGDNDKAIFGAGSDLQIYHSGTHSFINDAGTGQLQIRSNGTGINLRTNTNEEMLTAETNGAVTLYYDNASKLATTSTGIDVTGTVTADGLTVDGTIDLNIGTENVGIDISSTDEGSYILVNDNNATGFYFGARAGSFDLYDTNNQAIIKANSNGDISFYEDTGTTAKFFWDASAESLGIGTTSVSGTLALQANNPNIRFDDSDTSNNAEITLDNTTLRIEVDEDNAVADSAIKFQVDGSLKAIIDSSGNVGINTNAPNAKLEVKTANLGGTAGDSEESLRLTTSNTNADKLVFTNERLSTGTTWVSAAHRIQRVVDVSKMGYIQFGSNSSDLITFGETTTERMRIDGDGNLGIGTTSPASKLEVVSSSSGGAPVFSTSGTDHLSAIIGTAGGGFSTVTGNYFSIWHQPYADRGTQNNLTERMRIDSSGNVGIGTSSSASGGAIKLNLNGSSGGGIQFTNNNNGGGAIIPLNAGGQSFYTFTGAVGSETYSERMRIDSSGRVGIGTTSPTYKLDVRDSNNGDIGIHIYNTLDNNGTNDANAASVLFLSAASNNGYFRVHGAPTDAAADHQIDIGSTASSSFITFSNNGSNERMRIDSSGNVIVSKTATSWNTEGIVLFSDASASGSRIDVTTDGGTPVNLNRLTSDGEIAGFYKDGITVGSIGSAAGSRLFIGNGDTGIRFAGGLDTIVPWNTNNSLRDAAIDLGEATGRFKDLYLSGSLSDGTTSRTVADIVGLTSSQFLRSDASDTATGVVTFDNDSGINVVYSTSDTTNITGYGIISNRAAFYLRPTTDNSSTLYVGSSDASYDWSSIELKVGNNNNVNINGNTVWHAGNDGAGSGLDADTVDGIQASSFLRSDANDSFSGVLTSSQTSIGIQFDGAAAWRVSSSDTAHQRADARDDATSESRLHWYGVSTSGASRSFKHAWYDGSSYIHVTASSSNINFERTSGTANLQVQGNTVWNAGNDGAGSGLDADLLDGQDGSYYTSFANVTSKTSGTGDFATTGALQSGNGSGGVALTINDGYGNANITFNHKSGTPEQNGQCARIEVNTDNTTSGNAHMYFELGTGTSGVGLNLPVVFELGANEVKTYQPLNVTGAITATGDITAYFSDERLKDFDGKIDGALDKVSQLNGYYYRENDKAKELGFENDDRQVGVSAQEVEAVLPEVIKPAPVDPEYKTVQYEKLVPLLIEAIKELKEEVRQLKEDKA